jgi:hypothetical protein
MTAAQAHAIPLAASRARSIGKLSVAAILLLVIAAGSLAWAVWQLRVDVRRDAFEETGNLAVVLAGQLSRFLQTIDVVVAEFRDDLNELDSDNMTSWREALSSESMHDKLKGKLARIPQAFNIAVADAGGQVLASTARSSEESYVQWRLLKKPYRRSELQQVLAEMLGTQDDGDLPRTTPAYA